MKRPDFTKLVEALKGGLSKSVGFKPIKLGNFDGVRDPKVVDVWVEKWKTTFMSLRLGNIRLWNLFSLIYRVMLQHGGGW